MTDQEFSAFLGEDLSEEDRRKAREDLLGEARRWWEARSPFREERREARDYYRSRQWEGTITTPEGERIKEKDYIERQGRMSVVMNLVANVVNSVEGQFRQNASDRQAFAVGREDEEAARQINLARRATRRFNESDILEADQFKEHILSGASGFKQSFEWNDRLGRHEVSDYELDQTRLFYNLDVTDRRFKGLRMIGELHDIPLTELQSRFARSKKEAKRLEEVYGTKGYAPSGSFTTEFGFDQHETLAFNQPTGRGLCRVVELWKPVYEWTRTGLDPLFQDIPQGYGEISASEAEIARIQNQRRAQGLPLLELDEPRYEPNWHYWFLAPTGELIETGETPFLHGGHPYSLGAAMLVDGETWGIVSSIKDPQRWLNRLLAHIDHAMGSGAKGAVAYDESFMTENGLSQEDVDAWYSSADGALGVTVPQGKQIGDFVERFVSEKLPAGYVELIPTLTEFIEKISGVSGAMQGFEPKSGTPASLYQQQVSQASANILGYIESYFEGLRRKDRKTVQLLQQAITEPRTFASQTAGGQAGANRSVEVRPEVVRNIDFDISIGSVSDTATYRMLWEDYLMQMMESGAIPMEVYLQESSHPRAESLLQRMNMYQQEQLMQQAALSEAMEAPGEEETQESESER